MQVEHLLVNEFGDSFFALFQVMAAIALVFNFCIACKRHVGEVFVNHIVISLAVFERLQKIAIAKFKFKVVAF